MSYECTFACCSIRIRFFHAVMLIYAGLLHKTVPSNNELKLNNIVVAYKLGDWLSEQHLETSMIIKFSKGKYEHVCVCVCVCVYVCVCVAEISFPRLVYM